MDCAGEWTVRSFVDNSTARIAMVPTATTRLAKSICGDVFASLADQPQKQTPRIYFIGTLHRPMDTTSVYVPFRNDKTMPVPKWSMVDEKRFPAEIVKEESFGWIYPGLDARFPNAAYCVLIPDNEVSAEQLGTWLFGIHQNQKSTYFIFSVDLLVRSDNLPIPSPEREVKIELEEKLLCAFATGTTAAVPTFHTRSKTVLATLAKLNALLDNMGKIINYTDTIDEFVIRRTIHPEPFASYTGMIFSHQTDKSLYRILEFDTRQALSAVKSVIVSSRPRLPLHVLFPKWSIWYSIKNGMLFGSYFLDDKGEYATDWSALSFEDGKTSIAERIHCVREIKRRTSEKATDLFFLEIFDLEFKWTRMKAADLVTAVASVNHIRGGIRLTIQNKTVTYCSGVAKNWPGTFTQFMETMSRETGAKDDDWNLPTSRVELFNTKKFYL